MTQYWSDCFQRQAAHAIAQLTLRRKNLNTLDYHWTFWICVWGKLGQRNHVIITMSSFSSNLVPTLSLLQRDPGNEVGFRKPPFSRGPQSTLKGKTGVLKFPRFEERFQKALFLRWISVDDSPTRKNKATFSNFSGVVVDGSSVVSKHAVNGFPWFSLEATSSCRSSAVLLWKTIPSLQ